MSVLTGEEADALCEVTGGYGCALLSEVPVVSADGSELTTTALDDGRVVSYCAGVRHFNPTPEQIVIVGQVGRRIGALAHVSDIHAEVMADVLADAGIACRSQACTKPLLDYTALVVFR